MTAKDIIHDNVKTALVKDGWIITHDPYTIEFEEEFLYADLAAERVLAAEKGNQKIVVEIKSFAGTSTIQDFKSALGQYILYLPILAEVAPEYKLYLAIGRNVYTYDFQRKIIQFTLKMHNIPLIIVDIEKEEVIEWIN